MRGPCGALGLREGGEHRAAAQSGSGQRSTPTRKALRSSHARARPPGGDALATPGPVIDEVGGSDALGGALPGASPSSWKSAADAAWSEASTAKVSGWPPGPVERAADIAVVE